MTDNQKIFQTPYTAFTAPANTCGLFANYQIDGNGKCGRYASCHMADHTKDPKCPAKGGK